MSSTRRSQCQVERRRQGHAQERTLAHLKDNGVDMAASKLTVGPVLPFDPKNETFTDNEKAKAMLTREYRKPYVVPAAGQV